MPVVVDPSHGTGIASLVPSMSAASVAAGCDGLIIEVHPDTHARDERRGADVDARRVRADDGDLPEGGERPRQDDVKNARTSAAVPSFQPVIRVSQRSGIRGAGSLSHESIATPWRKARVFRRT